IVLGIASSYPEHLTASNGLLFFSAFESGIGRELWFSDGTSGGTFRLKDINPRTTGSYPANFANVGGTLFFSANDYFHGTELWKITYPIAVINGPSDGVRYQPRDFTFKAYDNVAISSLSIDWGDGTTQSFTNQSAVTLGHRYTATGTYTVT